MKAQSLEYQLRHTNPPSADPQARLRARRAALAEFERVHTQTNEEGTVAKSSDRRAFARWGSRNTLLSGVASACVVVIAVSAWWLIPADERKVQLQVPTASEVPPANEVPPASESAQPEASAQLRERPSQSESSPNADTSQQAENRREHASADTSSVQAAERKTEASGTPVTPPQQKRQTPSRVARVEQSPTLASELAQAPSPPPAQEQFVREPAEATPVDAGVTTNFEQSVVTRIQSLEKDEARTPATPSPQATGQATGIEEVIVSGANIRSFRRRDGLWASSASISMPEPIARVPSEGRDKFAHFDTNPVKRVSDEPVSTFSVDVDTASYSFVRRQLNAGVRPEADAVRVEEMINYFDYAWPVPESREQPFRPTLAVSDSPWGEGKKLIHIGIKGYQLPARQRPDVNLVMLIDVSGSMNSDDKLPLAKESLALLLDSLKPTDTVGIVVYAGAAGVVLEPTPVRENHRIMEALDSLEAGGSTAGGEGIRLAYKLAERSFRKGGVNRILLATDGDFNVGITNVHTLQSFVEREREKGIHLSVLGFGQGNYRDEMAQVLAQNGNGVAAYIDTLSEAKKVLVQESTASLFTIAKDVKLQVEFNPATVAEYRLVGYETRALHREDFNNDKVDAGDVGSGHTVTAIYEITPVASKARLIEESRYAARETVSAEPQGKTNEYGFLKIRYKLPNGVRSRLLEQPIRVDAGVPAALRKDVGFSTAVAGFAQFLRGGQYTGSLTLEDVMTQAEDSLGEDPYGYRREFMQLVRKAKDARGM